MVAVVVVVVVAAAAKTAAAAGIIVAIVIRIRRVIVYLQSGALNTLYNKGDIQHAICKYRATTVQQLIFKEPFSKERKSTVYCTSGTIHLIMIRSKWMMTLCSPNEVSSSQNASSLYYIDRRGNDSKLTLKIGLLRTCHIHVIFLRTFQLIFSKSKIKYFPSY